MAKRDWSVFYANQAAEQAVKRAAREAREIRSNAFKRNVTEFGIKKAKFMAVVVRAKTVGSFDWENHYRKWALNPGGYLRAKGTMLVPFTTKRERAYMPEVEEKEEIV